jgi:hypothetical protein
VIAHFIALLPAGTDYPRCTHDRLIPHRDALIGQFVRNALVVAQVVIGKNGKKIAQSRV